MMSFIAGNICGMALSCSGTLVMLFDACQLSKHFSALLIKQGPRALSHY